MGRLGRSGSTEHFYNFAKVSYVLMRMFFQNFHGQKRYKTRVAVHCSIRTKKMTQSVYSTWNLYIFGTTRVHSRQNYEIKEG